MKFLILSFLLNVVVTLSYAQNANTATIQWQVTAVENQGAGIHDGAGDKLITQPNTKVEWRDSSGGLKMNFEITSTIGTWTDINTNGLIHFNFEMEGQPGEIIIQRSAGVLSAEIQLYKADSSPQVYKLEISGYTVL